MSATEIAGQTVVAGASTLLLSFLGVDPQVLMWSLVGSVLGVTLAKPSGRLYATALFLAATLTCSLMGTVLGEYIKPDSAPVRNVCAVILGIGFHPLLQAFIGTIPRLVNTAADWFGKKFLGGQ